MNGAGLFTSTSRPIRRRPGLGSSLWKRFRAEVGRQPWVVYGLIRTADAHTRYLTAGDVLTSLIGYVVVYAIIYSFGIYYIYRLLHDGPTESGHEITGATAKRPMAAAGSAQTATGNIRQAGEKE